MKDKGTDRDVALDMLGSLNVISGAISQINANLYSPIIFTQPTDQTGALNSYVIFSVVAGNVKKYQWQYKADEESNWRNLSSDSATAANASVRITNDRLAWLFRCSIQGLDNTVIYTNSVKLILAT